MTSGMYRNAYPVSAAIHSPSRRLRTRLLCRGRRAEIAAPDPGGKTGERERRDGEQDREHTAERPVARLQELLLDHVADQAVFRSAEDVGNREDAKRRYEHQRRAGVDARQRERKGDAPETLPGVRAEVLCRIEQRLVVLLEIGVERQH